MSLFFLKFSSAFIIFISGLIAGLWPILRNPKAHELRIADAFACGVFLGAALFHMLPDAEHALRESIGHTQFPLVTGACVAGFILLYFVQVFCRILSEQQANSINIIPYILAIVLGTHAFIAGAALGLVGSVATVIIIFIAIMAHKCTASFALAINLIKSNMSRRTMMGAILIFSLCTPAGIFLGQGILPFLDYHHALVLQGIFNAFAAGTFIYIATMHGDGRRLFISKKVSAAELIAIITGLVLMAFVAIWI